MAKQAKVAKVVTGAVAQEEIVLPQEVAVSEEIETAALEQVKRELGFVDYTKSRVTIIKGEFLLFGLLAGPKKKRHWSLTAIKPDGKLGKIAGYFGDRKDGKGVYCRSEIKAICSEFKKAEELQVIKV